jgi:hypothetical protein
MAKEILEFQAQLLGWKQIHELPDGWPPGLLLSLLTNLEVDGVTEDDALEMTLMALQDREPDEAADRVMETIFGDAMRPGIRKNLAHDLTEDRPWEDFADISQQVGIFNAVVLLQQAFPHQFGRPDAVSVVVRLDTTSEMGKGWLDALTPDPALLLRILAEGMDDRAVLRRLFDEALRETSFVEAGAILWQVSRHVGAAGAREFELISSHQWFDPLKNLETWIAKAWPDSPVGKGNRAES